jgi:hypothetical protein
MSISCSTSEKGLARLSLWASVQRDDGCEMTVKGNDCGRWSSDGMVHWLDRRKNGDMVEWWGEWPRLR